MDSFSQEKRDKCEIFLLGKTEILNRLLINDRTREGIRNYFFGLHSLSLNSLYEIAGNSKTCLGNRYSENDNIKLKVSENLEALSNSEAWKKRFKDTISLKNISSFSAQEINAFDTLSKFNEQMHNIGLIINELHCDIPVLEKSTQLREVCISLENQIVGFLNIEDYDYKIYNLRKKAQDYRIKGEKIL